MRPIAQIVRFYLINRGITSRSIESLMDNPNYNPLLKHCVNTVKRYPDWAIETAKEHIDEVYNNTFKFNTGKWAMDIREEDLPKGTEADMHTLAEAFRDIVKWVEKNRAHYTQQLQHEEAIRNM